MPQPSVSKDGSNEHKASGLLRLLIIVMIVLVVSVAVTKGLMEFHILRAPYPPTGKSIAWIVRSPEPAYNFNEVVAGKVFRSSNPDEGFVDYVVTNYGIKRIVTLVGDQPWHEYARSKGIEIETYSWSTSALPALEELAAVQGYLDGATVEEPVLVHCSAGADRTGYAVALYRVQTEKWSQEDAVEEMRSYWHYPETKAQLHQQIDDYLNPREQTASASVAVQ
ncbi:tyrosine-protein phosphatase [Poriferisphaera sp. WC338]|uniref:tyrosine-protein phosphatase n=1 Tax=Poriferisphaera sp. WC338 TaxID=3425129 RepID=UPI003D81BB64